MNNSVTNYSYLSCEICDEGFNKDINYRLHLSTHRQSKSDMITTNDDIDTLQFGCPICERRFSRWASFRCHLALHRVDDTIICQFCGEELQYYVS